MMRLLINAVAGIATLVMAAAATAAPDKMVAAFSTVGFAYLPPLVAKAMDLYKTENIDTEIVITGGETKALAALVGGGADVYFGSAPTVLRGRQNGIDTVIVSNVVGQYATNLVVSKEWAQKKGITATSSVEDKLKALKGATLGITAPGSGTDLIMRFFAVKAGLNPDRDMTLNNLGGSDIIFTAFAQRRIDGFALSAPVAENAVKNHGAIMLLNLSKGELKDLDGFLYTAVAFKQDFLTKKPDLVVRFLKTQQKALDAIHDPAITDKARDAVWKMYWSQTDKALFDDIWANWKAAFPKTVLVPSNSVKQMLEFTNLLESKKIDVAEAMKAINNNYAEKALAEMKK